MFPAWGRPQRRIALPSSVCGHFFLVLWKICARQSSLFLFLKEVFEEIVKQSSEGRNVNPSYSRRFRQGYLTLAPSRGPSSCCQQSMTGARMPTRKSCIAQSVKIRILFS
eukprot:scaffold4060_cov190-Amphora_coffeaeformis.AAC.27